MSQVKVRFWGVRGSVPAPLTSKDVEKKIFDFLGIVNKSTGTIFVSSLLKSDKLFSENLPFTYGGNTSCVEVCYGDHVFVLDMGTGLRPLGNSLFPEMMKKNGLHVNFFLSHVHWDHIQGLPFFGPLYANKENGVLNKWHFYGGTDWQKTAEICLRGQMDPPTFPVSWREIEKITHEIKCFDMYDMMRFSILNGTDDTVKVFFRKLDHPQETYGIRMEFPNGKVVAYTTDNEPRNPANSDPRLLDLVYRANLWVTDCQYTRDIYNGKVGGVCRHGWGHSYPEAVARTAVEASVEKVILFHHDPNSSDEAIDGIEEKTKQLIREYSEGAPCIGVQAAWEGLEINI